MDTEKPDCTPGGGAFQGRVRTSQCQYLRLTNFGESQKWLLRGGAF